MPGNILHYEKKEISSSSATTEKNNSTVFSNLLQSQEASLQPDINIQRIVSEDLESDSFLQHEGLLKQERSILSSPIIMNHLSSHFRTCQDQNLRGKSVLVDGPPIHIS